MGKADNGDSVGVNDLDDIVTSCTQHNATGYLLAYSTQPSSAVMNRLEGISYNPNNPLTALWDAVTLERLLFNRGNGQLRSASWHCPAARGEFTLWQHPTTSSPIMPDMSFTLRTGLARASDISFLASLQ